MSSPSEKQRPHRRYGWFIVCTVVAAVAIGVTMVQWKRSVRAQAAQRAALVPNGTPTQATSIIPNPFGTDAEVLAAVPAEYVAGLGNIKDDRSRLAQARAFAAEGHFSGATAELGTFLEFIDEYQIIAAPPASQEGREKTRTASFMLFTLVAAWQDAGPFDPATERRLEAAAIKLAGDVDSTNQTVSLGALRVLASPGSHYSLSQAGKRAIDSLAADSQVSFQADRVVKDVLARPKRRDKGR